PRDLAAARLDRARRPALVHDPLHEGQRSASASRGGNLAGMKAAVYYRTGRPDVFSYEDVPDPACHPNGVVVDVEAISIEGGDTLNRGGGAMTSTPHIVGYQCAGTISEAGANVKDRQVGQRVVATMPNGSHAEKVAVPARVTWPIPDGADIVAAARVALAFGPVGV